MKFPIMKCIVRQIYATFKRSENFNPDLSTRLYLLSLTFFIFIWSASFAISFFDKIIFKENLNVNSIWLVCFSIVFLYVFGRRYQKIFSKKKLDEILRAGTNGFLPIFWGYAFMLIAFMLLLFLGPMLSIFIFGGKLLGTRITGIFE